MGAMTLLVDRRGAELKVNRGHTVCLSYPDGYRHRVGLYALRRILIYGEINLSSSLLRACNTAEVSVILFPGRGKGDNINLFPNNNGHSKLRQAQYRAYFDNDFCLDLARQIVSAKISAQSLWLNHHNLNCDFSSALSLAKTANSNASLMGIEGSVAREYFSKWRSLWNEDWGFNERNRRPPRDPVNALLSLGYTIAGNQVGQLLSSYGLDLSLGFLHIPHNNRPSLSLDLLESVRPWVDEWLWKFVQSDGLLIPSQFTQTEENGCRLNHTGRSAFYAAWYDNAEVWLLKPIRDNIAMLLRNLRKYSDLVDSNNNYIS